MEAGAVEYDAFQAAKHREAAIRYGNALATALARDQSSLTGRQGLCWATLASLKLADLIKPTNPKRLGVLHAALERLEITPKPYRNSPQVRRWLVLTRLSTANAFSDRGERDLALETLRKAIDEARAADQEVRTVASAVELLTWIQTAEHIRAGLQPQPTRPAPEWRSLVQQTCARIAPALASGRISNNDLPALAQCHSA
jgi:hypothetical protein